MADLEGPTPREKFGPVVERYFREKADEGRAKPDSEAGTDLAIGHLCDELSDVLGKISRRQEADDMLQAFSDLQDEGGAQAPGLGEAIATGRQVVAELLSEVKAAVAQEGTQGKLDVLRRLLERGGPGPLSATT